MMSGASSQSKHKWTRERDFTDFYYRLDDEGNEKKLKNYVKFSWWISKVSPPELIHFWLTNCRSFLDLAALRRTNPPGNVFNLKLKSPYAIFYGNLSARLNW